MLLILQTNTLVLELGIQQLYFMKCLYLIYYKTHIQSFEILILQK
jgi:hypothetical protein